MEFWQILHVRESAVPMCEEGETKTSPPGWKFQDWPQRIEDRRGSLAKWIPTSQGSHVLWSPNYWSIIVENTVWGWKWIACTIQISFKESPGKSFQNKYIHPGEKGWAFQNGWGRAGHKKWKPILKKDSQWYWSNPPAHCQTTDLKWDGVLLEWVAGCLKLGKNSTKMPCPTPPQIFPILKGQFQFILGEARASSLPIWKDLDLESRQIWVYVTYALKICKEIPTLFTSWLTSSTYICLPLILSFSMYRKRREFTFKSYYPKSLYRTSRT